MELHQRDFGNRFSSQKTSDTRVSVPGSYGSASVGRLLAVSQGCYFVVPSVLLPGYQTISDLASE
eukprot:177244-Rhodomonas_salina.1